MTREIKFRAWNKQTSVLEPWDDAYIATWFWHPEHFDLMQYTGLKDRNGTEIYEGDVLVRHSDNDRRYMLVWDDLSAGYEAKLLDGANVFYYHIKSGDDEVIGNIHENKRLLNDPS